MLEGLIAKKSGLMDELQLQQETDRKRRNAILREFDAYKEEAASSHQWTRRNFIPPEILAEEMGHGRLHITNLILGISVLDQTIAVLPTWVNLLGIKYGKSSMRNLYYGSRLPDREINSSLLFYSPTPEKKSSSGFLTGVINFDDFHSEFVTVEAQSQEDDPMFHNRANRILLDRRNHFNETHLEKLNLLPVVFDGSVFMEIENIPGHCHVQLSLSMVNKEDETHLHQEIDGVLREFYGDELPLFK